MNTAAWAANPLTTDINDQPPWSDDMTNQGNVCHAKNRVPQTPLHQAQTPAASHNRRLHIRREALPAPRPHPWPDGLRSAQKTRKKTLGVAVGVGAVAG